MSDDIRIGSYTLVSIGRDQYECVRGGMRITLSRRCAMFRGAPLHDHVFIATGHGSYGVGEGATPQEAYDAAIRDEAAHRVPRAVPRGVWCEEAMR